VVTQSPGSCVGVWIPEPGDEGESESVREDWCWLRRFFGIVRLDSVKFGRFGLPEWDVLTSGDVVTALIPSVRCGSLI
jgi:hypothetical protein